MLKKGLRLKTILTVIWFVMGALAACGGPGVDGKPPCSTAGADAAAEPCDETDADAAAEPCDETATDLTAAQDYGGLPGQDMQQYLRQVTVQLQGPRYLGSGVVWSVEEDMLVIATAAHVAEDNSPMTVQFEQGEPLETWLRHISDQADVAFVEVSLQQLEEQEISWQTARQDREVCDQLEEGQQLWIMGSVEEAADRTYEGSVTQPWIYLEDFGNYMLLGHAYAIPGASGGGVFTHEGILVGILCGGNEEDQIAVLPWSVMEANSQT